MFSGDKERISTDRRDVCLPFCQCCGGGDRRKGYMMTKAASRRKSIKARKPRYKDKR